MNEVSIISLTENHLEIARENSDKQYNLRLEKILSQITNNNFKVLTLDMR
jgi:hypothetical protein